MIRVDFDPTALSPERRRDYEDWTVKANRALEKIAAEANPNPESRATVWREFKGWLAEHFFAFKCAYCEGPLGEQTTGAAEHWRPKSAVQECDGDETWNAVVDEVTNERHCGYWWLAFAWENLVPACSLCNEKKGVKFPIAGERIFARHAVLDVGELDRREQPLLLHPYRGDDPRRHIGFRAKGEAYAKNESPLGGATIRVCDLNRWPLHKARAKAQRSAIDRFMLACVATAKPDADVDVDDEMEELDTPRAHYSQAVREGLRASENGLLASLQRRRQRRVEEGSS